MNYLPCTERFKEYNLTWEGRSPLADYTYVYLAMFVVAFALHDSDFFQVKCCLLRGMCALFCQSVQMSVTTYFYVDHVMKECTEL